MTAASIQYVKESLPIVADDTRMCVGRVPSSAAIGAARASMLHASTYRRNGIMCIGERGRDETIDSNYRVIYPNLIPLSASDPETVNIMFSVRCLPYYDSTSVALSINGDTVQTRTVTANASGGTAGNDRPDGEFFQVVYACPVDSLSSDIYTSCTVTVTNAIVASMTAQMVPEVEQTIGGIMYMAPGLANPSVPLIGYDRDNGQNGSLDSMLQNQITIEGAQKTSVLTASRRCLFGWSCPQGRHSGTSATGWIDLMKDSFRPVVRPRNLIGSAGNVPVDLVILWRGDTGCKIKFSSVYAGDSYEWTPTANTTATPLIREAIGQLDVYATLDEIQIEVYRTTTAACEIHAIGIFESATGTTV